MVGFIVLKKESTYICATYRKCMNAMKNYTYHLVAVLTVGIWGLTFISTKVLIGHGLSPQEIFLLRFLIAYMGIWLISPRKLFADNWKDEFWMFLGGITGGSFYFFTEKSSPKFNSLFVSHFKSGLGFWYGPAPCVHFPLIYAYPP